MGEQALGMVREEMKLKLFSVCIFHVLYFVSAHSKYTSKIGVAENLQKSSPCISGTIAFYAVLTEYDTINYYEPIPFNEVLVNDGDG